MNKKIFCFAFALFFTGTVFAEFRFLGGIFTGVFNDSVSFNGEKQIESAVPMGLSFQFDYFPFPDFWVGFSAKASFGGNVFYQYGEKDGERFYIDTSDKSHPHASLFFNLSPNVTFRYVFKNHRYLAGSVGLLYSVSHFNLPMVSKYLNEMKYYRRENTKNAFGLNFEIFYRLAKTALDQGISLNANWLFLEWNSHLYDSAAQLSGIFTISLGYQIGWTIPVPGQARTAAQKERIHLEALAEEERLKEIKRQEDEAKKSLEDKAKLESELDDFLKTIIKSAKGAKSPIVILGCEAMADANGNVSVSIEFQNISGKDIKQVEFNVVPLNKSKRQIPVADGETVISIERSIFTDSESVVIFKRNFFSNPEIVSVTVKSIEVTFADGSTVAKNGLSRILLSQKQQNQLKKLREAADAN